MSEAISVMRRMSNAQSSSELWSLVTTSMAAYGFRGVIYGFTRSRQGLWLGDPDDILFLSNMRPISGGGKFDRDFFMRTPMFRWVMENTGACSWHWAAQEAAAGGLTASEINARERSRAAGIIAGYTISFPDPSPRTKGGMALCAAEDRTQADVDAQWSSQGDEIMAICSMMHMRMIAMPMPTAGRTLSPRQREALEWVAEGKTTQDIAVIMGVSPAMVEKHLRLARETLNVETTAHAIAKAARLNHLFVDQPKLAEQTRPQAG